MSHSFGEGYATRSDEEGFGGIYGGNQSLSHDDEDKDVHGNHPGRFCLITFESRTDFFFFQFV